MLCISNEMCFECTSTKITFMSQVVSRCWSLHLIFRSSHWKISFWWVFSWMHIQLFSSLCLCCVYTFFNFVTFVQLGLPTIVVLSWCPISLQLLPVIFLFRIFVRLCFTTSLPMWIYFWLGKFFNHTGWMKHHTVNETNKTDNQIEMYLI